MNTKALTIAHDAVYKLLYWYTLRHIKVSDWAWQHSSK